MNCLYLDQNYYEVLLSLNNKEVLVQVMTTTYRMGDNPLPEPMMNRFFN